VPQVVRVSPGRESGAKRNLGVWAPAARCGNICSSPQVRDYQVRERIGTEYRNSKRQPHPLQEQN
jgi:hypothetical protein